ncbi:DUF4307 domain-containing protein [Nocardia otitidiscaviarum]|nr:DUF4307 domain-containing protein [Nocardia otitidiscaviarum]MBF6238322.1 DUF4307 domain-containing protein [Nocardia otitidiscaviarum]MBF6482799.1 DUF4307 domain-containing protein [Nocardia otitidiscaviarum]
MFRPTPRERAVVIQRPADRYGTAPRKAPRSVLILLGVLVVVAGLVVAYLGYRQYGPQDIEAERIGYDVIDDSTVTLDFKVTRAEPNKPVVCYVRALDPDQVEVGRREVLIAGSTDKTVRIDTVIRTSARTGAASVYGCSDKVPAYLHAG